MVSGAPTTAGSLPKRFSLWVWGHVKRMRRWSVDAWAGFLGGVLASLVLLLLLALKAEWVADLTLGANPSCSSPRGLHEVPIVAAEAGSTQAKRADGSVIAEPATDPDSHYVAQFAIDGASNTTWIPEIVNDLDVVGADEPSREPEFLSTDGANELALSLEEEADVRLVCVMNGSGLWFTSYQNFGRVRSVEVWREGGEKKLGILQSLGSQDFPNAQVAGRNLGDTDTVHLKVLDAYAGIQVENFNARACLDGATVSSGPAAGQKALTTYVRAQGVRLASDVLYRWPDGCIQEPKVKAGIAEVRVYATD